MDIELTWEHLEGLPPVAAIVVWDTWRGTIDPDTIRLAQGARGTEAWEYDLVRAVGGWNLQSDPNGDATLRNELEELLKGLTK